jgi:hypothetical protein
MSMGCRSTEQQPALWIPTADLPHRRAMVAGSEYGGADRPRDGGNTHRRPHAMIAIGRVSAG